MVLHALYTCLFTSAVLIVSVNVARGQETIETPIQDILRAWTLRQKAIQTAIYRIEGEQTLYIVEGSDGIRSRKGETRRRHEATLTIDFVHSRYRHESYEQQISPLRPRFRSVSAYDGQVARAYSTRDPHPGPKLPPPRYAGEDEFYIFLGNQRNGAFSFPEVFLFLGHGFISTPEHPIIPGSFHKHRPDADYFIYHGPRIYRGRNCHVIRTVPIRMTNTTFKEYWVDPAQDCAMVRWVMYLNDKIDGDVEITYKKHGNHWLVSAWAHTTYSLSEIDGVEKGRVLDIQINPSVPDSQFYVERPPHITKEIEMYKEPSDDVFLMIMEPKWEREFVIDSDGTRRLVRSKGVIEEEKRWSRKPSILGLVILALLFAVIGVGIWYKIARGRR
ncbi:MAG: hypothetical protein N2039_08625 [Gemmataceae bacterium]|nr:hypothetical protein [Gemmataceae bacterium]